MTGKVLPWVCVLAFVVPTVYTAIACWHTLFYPADANFGEGVLTYEASRLLHGRSIYLDPAQPPFWMATYPPLYQLLVALGGATSLVWQRLLSLLFSLASAGSLILVLRRLGQPWAVALLAALLWINSLFVEIWNVLGRVDMTGRGLCSIAIASAIGFRRQQIAFIAALIFAVLAMMVKQNMIAGALTCAVVLGTQRWQRGAWFLLSWFVAVSLVYLSLNAVTGKWFWRDIFALTNRSLSFAQFQNWVTGFVTTHLYYLAAAAAGAWVLCMRKPTEWWLFAALVVGIPNAVLSANDGSDRNYFFDLVWAVCAFAAIGVGAALNGKKRIAGRVAALVATTALVINAALLIRGPAEYPTPRQSDTARGIIAQLRESRKPVLSELTAFTIAADSEVEYLPYMLRKLEEDGRWDPVPVVDRIERKYYGAILLTHLAPNRMGRAELEAISRNYEVAAEFPDQFLSEGSGTFVLLRPAGETP